MDATGGGGGRLLFRYGLGLAMSSIYRAVAIVRLRGRPPPRPVSPPAAAAGTTVHHVTGIISEVSIREPSSSCSSPAAAAGGIAPAGHGIESIGRGEIVEEALGRRKTRFVTKRPNLKREKKINAGVGDDDLPYAAVAGMRSDSGGLGLGSWER